jgi:hypothetical protein
MWIDAQGYEGKILNGAQKSLHLIKVIFTEVNFEEVYAGTTLFNELKFFLEENNFELIKVWKNWPQGDALFVNRSMGIQQSSEWKDIYSK